MKKQFFLLACVLTIAFFSSHAQIKPAVLTETPDNSEEQFAKKAIDLVVMARFNKKYANVSDEAWTKIANGYQVNFTKDGITHSVFLNKKGKSTGEIRYLTEKNLPGNVLELIKNMDGCFTIGACKEVTTELGKAYLVTIDYGTTWKVMQIVGDEMNVFEEHKKG